jgi:predicted PurR-regulated permease PerM
VLTIRRVAGDGLPFAAVAVAAVVCCAGLPALATLLGGLALGAVLGIAGSLLAIAALGVCGLLVLRTRRRRHGGSASDGTPT